MSLSMTKNEQTAAVMAAPIPFCPCCGHGMDLFEESAL